MSDVLKTVLVADDDEEIVRSLSRMVRSLGNHRVLLAYSGTEALELLRSERVDLLLSDIDMPGIDGVTLASMARAESLAPVRILVTGNARLESALAAINAGEVHRYLTKPWNAQELTQILTESMARLDELVRVGAASQVARRLREATEALEAEYPGITQVEREGRTYLVNLESVAWGRTAFAGSVLAMMLDKADD